jgi:NTE family protein
LGYFDLISYEVEPASNGHVKLYIHVKEKIQQIVQVGFHYDDYYKLVASLGIRFPNFILPGFQLKSILQISGRTLADFKLSYPFRSNYISMLPYINYVYKDFPVTIYTELGDKVASYLDRSSSPGFGINFWFGRFSSLDIGFKNEYILVEPDIAFPDPLQLPSWDDELRLLLANLVVDSRDDAILPKYGLHLNVMYENSLEALETDLVYNRYSATAEYYHTFAKHHTLRASGFYGWSSAHTPVYKYFYTDSPDKFIGFDYFQLYGSNFGFARMDYRYRYKRDIYFKLIYNVARSYFEYPALLQVADYMHGWGVGVKFLSLLGPLEIIYARGPKNVLTPVKWRNVLYVQAGFRL